MFRVRLSLLVNLLAVTIPTYAQSFKAWLVGVVTDAQRDAIPGATVTLERADTGEKLTAVSDEEGRYSFQQVTSGVYVLCCEPQGFAVRTRAEVFPPRRTGTKTVRRYATQQHGDDPDWTSVHAQTADGAFHRTAA